MNLPALTMVQMAKVDLLMEEKYGIVLLQMMENAGRQLARLAVRMLGETARGRRVVILAGGGNNGGGGMVAARHLHNWGANVAVWLVGDAQQLGAVPADQWDILQMMALTQGDPPDLAAADLIIDAMIGYGLRGEPCGAAAEWIAKANESGRPLLSLDIPSGLDSTSGHPANLCIEATATMTLALPKTGLLTPAAKRYVGQLYLADISVPPELYHDLDLTISPVFDGDGLLQIL